MPLIRNPFTGTDGSTQFSATFGDSDESYRFSTLSDPVSGWAGNQIWVVNDSASPVSIYVTANNNGTFSVNCIPKVLLSGQYWADSSFDSEQPDISFAPGSTTFTCCLLYTSPSPRD